MSIKNSVKIRKSNKIIERLSYSMGDFIKL